VRLYSNENFPQRAVNELRSLGHDVLTSFDAGKANQRIPDDEVLKFATAESRCLLTLNRRDFIKLHRHGGISHCGIIVCTYDSQPERQARSIHDAIAKIGSIQGQLVRVNLPNAPI